MNRTAITKTTLVLLTFLLSFSDKMAIAQSLTSVNPDSAYTDQQLTVSIYGQNTTFTQGTLVNSWLNQGASILNLSSLNPVNDTLLTGILDIPANADTGNYDANVTTSLMGTISLVNAFYIATNPMTLGTSQTNILCAPLCTGTATAVASGCSPYTYLWNDPSAQTSSTATGLCAGSYSVTVTGNLGCSRVASVNITQPSVLLVSTTFLNDTSVCSGSGTANASGGTGSYAYLWDDPLSQTTATAIGLCAGVYHVTVTDGNGCTDIDSIEVFNIAGAAIVVVSPDSAEQSQTLTVNIYGQNTLFTQGSGTASAWLNQGASVLNLSSINIVNDTLLDGILSIPSNASTGLWDVNVTTVNTLTKVNAFYIGTNGLSLTLSKTDPLCGSPCDGTATVSVTGCSGVYTYLWNDLFGQTTSTATGLCGGTFTVIVSDNTGCNNSGSVTLTQPIFLNATTSATNTLSGCNGSGTVVATGGSTPYSYLWDDPLAQTNSTATGLCAGVYQVTVTDNAGCTSFGSVSVLAAGIDSVSPNTGYQGTTLTVSIYGQNTSFTQATATPNAWFNQGPSIINLSGINVINDNLLTGVLNIPSNAGEGYWDANVFVDIIGTFTKTDAFYICGGNCVWPGDANSDNIANNIDLLAIGTAFGSTGTVRPAASLNWVGQLSADWVDTLISGVNYKHVDCNGDALIDNSDTLAISLNYGFTHNKTNQPSVAAATDPALYFDVVDTTSTGAQLSIIVNLGTLSIPADSIYGLAFTLNYEPDLVDSGTVKMSFANSWIGTIGTDLITIQYDSYSDGIIDVGIVRTDHADAAGFGEIARLTLQTTSNLPGGSTVDTLNFSVSGLTVITSNEEPLSVNTTPGSVIVDDVQTGLEHQYKSVENDVFLIYPNPNTGQFTIIRNNAEQGGELTLVVYQINGQKVVEETSIQEKTEINLTHLSKGIYYLQVRSATTVVTKKVIIQ